MKSREEKPGRMVETGIVWLTEADKNFRVLGLRVGKPGSQGKLDVVRVQQGPGRPRCGQESKSVL